MRTALISVLWRATIGAAGARVIAATPRIVEGRPRGLNVITEGSADLPHPGPEEVAK